MREEYRSKGRGGKKKGEVSMEVEEEHERPAEEHKGKREISGASKGQKQRVHLKF